MELYLKEIEKTFNLTKKPMKLNYFLNKVYKINYISIKIKQKETNQSKINLNLKLKRIFKIKN